MNRDQKIKIAMVVCVVVLLCAVIVTSTGLFGSSGIGGYANAEKYTAGDTEITDGIRNIDINWTSGKVIVAYHDEKTVTLRETAKRALSENEKLRWWLDGDTLRVQFTSPGIRWNQPGKELTITLPEGMALDEAAIRTTSADTEIPLLNAKKLTLESTSGVINAASDAEEVQCHSTSGDQQIRLTGKTEKAEVQSTSGDIRLEAEEAGKIEAGSTSGGIGITAEECRETKAGSTSGNIYINLKKLEKLEVSATSGSVTAALPADPGFTADVNSTSGDLTSTVALTQDGNRYVCGDGSAKAEIHTTSGDVRIEAADSSAEEE